MLGARSSAEPEVEKGDPRPLPLLHMEGRRFAESKPWETMCKEPQEDPEKSVSWDVLISYYSSTLASRTQPFPSS